MALQKANTYNNKHNAKLCRIFTEAGGLNNSEYQTPMYQLLDKVKRAVGEVSHLNNQDKLKTMSRKGVGWSDILKEAEETYKGMTIERNVRWPPACNTTNLKAPATNFGANLVQTMGKGHNNSNRKGKFKRHSGKSQDSGKQKKKSNDSKFAWKTSPPKSSEKRGSINGHPVYEKNVNGKKYYWCAKCGDKGRWTLSHSTGEHTDDFNKSKNGRSRSHGQVNIGEGLVPDARVWLAECNVLTMNDSPQVVKKTKKRQPRR